MPAERVQRIQDAVHGLMEFRGLETALLDVLSTRELQRLRRVRQLGLGHQVFPAAEHSRLVHAIGSAHLAIRFVRRLEDVTEDFLDEALRPDQESRRDMALAALVHDIGHGPLSHTWEEVMKDFDRQAWSQSLGLAHTVGLGVKWHEMVGQALLAWEEGDLHQTLDAQEAGTAERIRRMLAGHYYLPYLPGLLDSDVDVDRCDYLIRDAMMSGVAYGRYDVNWLISTATVGRLETDDLVVGFDYVKAPRVVEQFIIARRALYDIVYQHKTVRSAEGMVTCLIQRFMALAKEGKLPLDEADALGFAPVFRGEPLDCEQVLALDDYSLWQLVARTPERSTDETSRDLAQRILKRNLFKNVDVPERARTSFLGSGDWKEQIAKAIGDSCPGDPHFYFYVDERDFPVWEKADRTEHAEGGDRPASKDAFFVQPRVGGPGRATLAREHPILETIGLGQAPDEKRLFVAAEAKDAVEKMIRG